jgi:uncharacterized protein (AIM24 family)/thioredoxin-like negative regulator of GroEL
VATLRTQDEIEGQDEEFLFHLGRGAELLAAGEAGPARASLARALELRPKDSKALGLLGQADYRLGRYEEAADAYGRLVNENPVEAAARVNLGLANLKAKRYPEAVRQLEVALDLNPVHKKAMGYLGLAFLETGEFLRAREWFERAGTEQMVVRCDELIALSRPETMPEAQPEETPAPAALPAPVPTPPEPPPSAVAEVMVAPPYAESPFAEAPVPQLPTTPSLSALAEARLVHPAAVETFAVARGLLTVAVRGEVLVRGRGLAAVRGAVRLAPEVKRFRGKATDKPFGEGSDRMLRASGEGALLYRAGTRRLGAVDLGGESGYFREEVVFGFEDQLAFENGRVASRIGADLNLVHLRGRGRLLLSTAGEIVALPASADAPVRVPLAVLAGWTGALTPRVTPLQEGGDPADPSTPLAVDLTGEGKVLLDPEAAPGA